MYHSALNQIQTFFIAVTNSLFYANSLLRLKSLISITTKSSGNYGIWYAKKNQIIDYAIGVVYHYHEDVYHLYLELVMYVLMCIIFVYIWWIFVTEIRTYTTSNRFAIKMSWTMHMFYVEIW